MAFFTAMFAMQRMPYYQLERSGREIRAAVVRTRPDNHGDVDLVYSVNDREYRITTSPGEGNPEMDELQPGDSVFLTYLPSQPDLARGGRRPAGTVTEAAMALAVVAVFIAAMMLLFVRLIPIKANRIA